MDSAELDKRARLRRFVVELKRELIVDYGIDERRVNRLSLEGLLREKRRVLDDLMMPGPRGAA